MKRAFATLALLAFTAMGCNSLDRQIKESRERSLGEKSVAVYGEKVNQNNDNAALLRELKADDPACHESSNGTTNWIQCTSLSDEHIQGISLLSQGLKGGSDRAWIIAGQNELNQFLAKMQAVRELERKRQYRGALAEIEAIPGIEKSAHFVKYRDRLREKAQQPEKDLNTVLHAIEKPAASELDDPTAAQMVSEAFEAEPSLATNEKYKARYQAIAGALTGNVNCSVTFFEPPGEVYISTGYPVPATATARCNNAALQDHFGLRITADKVRFGSTEINAIKPTFVKTRTEIGISELSANREENVLKLTAEPRFAATFAALAPLSTAPAMQFQSEPAEYTLKKVPVYFSAEYERLARGSTPSAPWKKLRGKETEVTMGMNGQFTMGGTRNGEAYDMVFGHPNGKYAEGIWSSYITLKINDNLYRFDKLANQRRSESDDHTTLTIEADIPEENATAIVTMQMFAKENYNLGIEVKNNSAESKKIGMRYLIDTWAGKSDGVPFLTPAATGADPQLHTKEFKFSPSYSTLWETIDVGGDGYVYLRNTLNGSGLVAPDQVAFVQWGAAFRSEWDYPVSSEKTILGDSAALLWWHPRAVDAGQTRRVATRFGVFQRNQKTIADVQDAKSGFGYIYVERTNTSKQPKSYRFDLESPDADIQLPSGKSQEFTLAPNERSVRAIPVSLAGAGQKTVTLKEYEDGAQSPKISTVTFDLAKDEGHSSNVPVWQNVRPYPVRYVANRAERKLRCVVKSADGQRMLGNGDLKLIRSDAAKAEHIYGADISLPADYRGETIVDIYER